MLAQHPHPQIQLYGKRLKEGKSYKPLIRGKKPKISEQVKILFFFFFCCCCFIVVVLEAEFFCIALSVLELTDQASLELRASPASDSLVLLMACASTAQCLHTRNIECSKVH